MNAAAKILWLFWFCCAAFITWHTQFSEPFPHVNIDEHAHYSYTMDLLRTHSWWPDFNHFPLTDAATGKPQQEANYLNHPPTFYWLMEVVHRAFPHASPIRYRIPSLLFCIAALAVYARIGELQQFGAKTALVYALLPLLLYVPLATGYYSNDSLALLGGALACLGAALELKQRPHGLFYLCLGVALASVKLTSLMLVGLFALLFLLQQRAHKKLGLLAVLIALVSIPYAMLWLRYGSFAPETAGQVEWLTFYAGKRGWLHAPRMDHLHWLLSSLAAFAHQFKGPEVTPLALLLLIAAFFTPRAYGKERSLLRAAWMATLVVLAAHLAFSWPRYVRYGWLYDMFTRYYFPLLPAYGIAIANFYQRLSKRQ